MSLFDVTADKTEEDYWAYGLLLSACKLKGEGNSERILRDDCIGQVYNKCM